MKVFMFDKISEDVQSFDALPRQIWMVLGIIELICVIGLIVPSALHLQPSLTAVAATVLAIESLVFIGVRVKYRELTSVIFCYGMGSSWHSLLTAGLRWHRSSDRQWKHQTFSNSFVLSSTVIWGQYLACCATSALATIASPVSSKQAISSESFFTEIRHKMVAGDTALRMAATAFSLTLDPRISLAI